MNIDLNTAIRNDNIKSLNNNQGVLNNKNNVIELTNIIFPDNNLMLLDRYLDEHNINNDDDIKPVLKFIQVEFFEKRLPISFLVK